MRFLPLALINIVWVLDAGPARAESSCETGGLLSGTQPTNGQVEVPIDMHPRVLVNELVKTDCEPSFSYATLTLTKEGERVAATQVDTEGWMDIKELVPDALLEPNTTYALTVSGDLESVEVSFTTGSAKAEPLTSAPEVEILSAREDASVDGHDGLLLNMLSFRIAPTQGDPDGLSVVRLVGDDWSQAAFIIGTDSVSSSVHYWNAEGAPICVRAAQVSANGTEVISDEVCAQPEPAGCQAGRGSATRSWLAMVAIAMGGLYLRRKRGRMHVSGGPFG